MDVIMEKSRLECRRELWCGSARREEMAECVVPDTYPDIERIIDRSAQVLIRGKTAGSGRVTVDCGVICTLLYAAEGSNELFRIETEIPVSVSVEVSQADEETDVVAVPMLESVEIRTLNPRKILAKAEIRIEISCFEKGEITVSSTVSDTVHLEILEKSCDVSPVIDVREKTFVITDEITVPPASEGYSRILCHKADLEVQDVRFVGSKLIFKAQAKLGILADTNDAAPVFFGHIADFSQIIELGTQADNASVQLCMTGCYLELEHDEQGKEFISAQLHILAQAVSTVNREVQYAADAYSNRMDCSLEFEELVLPVSCNEKQIRDSCRCTLETASAAAKIVFADASCACTGITDDGITANVNVKCIYADEEGRLNGAAKCITIRLDAEKTEGIKRIRLICGDVYAVPSAEGIDLRVPVEAVVAYCTDITVKCVSSIELAEREVHPTGPSVYIVPGGEYELWELAKKYSSTVKLIEENNTDMTGVLLIPVQK